MELLNAVQRFDEPGPTGRAIVQESLEIAVLALAPIVPHVTHALWHELGHERAVIDEPWPKPRAAALAQAEVELVVQVNGKLRGRITVPAGAVDADVRAAALADPGVVRFIGAAAVKKLIVVPGKLVNVVI